MDPRSLLKFVRMLREFTKGAIKYHQEDEELIGQLPRHDQDLIRLTGRRILRFGYFGVFTSLIVLPIAAPSAIVLLDGIPLQDAFWRGVMLLGFFPMTFFLGAYWGISVGMLMTPTWYLGTEVGIRWQEICGTHSVAGCRFISLIVAVVGFGCYYLGFWFARTMAPFT